MVLTGRGGGVLTTFFLLFVFLLISQRAYGLPSRLLFISNYSGLVTTPFCWIILVKFLF